MSEQYEPTYNGTFEVVFPEIPHVVYPDADITIHNNEGEPVKRYHFTNVRLKHFSIFDSENVGEVKYEYDKVEETDLEH